MFAENAMLWNCFGQSLVGDGLSNGAPRKVDQIPAFSRSGLKV
jgi:hypothetical protein